MPRYRVVWEIDIEAGSRLQAARQALEIQRDPQSTATVFEVSDWDDLHIEADRNRARGL